MNESIASLIFWGKEKPFALIWDRKTISWLSCPKPSHFNEYGIPAVYFSALWLPQTLVVSYV
jgi:hypothetical protein